jgi:hypothetical protein
MSIFTQKTKHSIKLTSAEIANLWKSYLNDTLAVYTIGKIWMEQIPQAVDRDNLVSAN